MSIMDKNLELYLKLDKLIDGKVIDSSEKNRTNALYGTPTEVEDNFLGKCLQFNGKDTYIELNHHRELNPADAFTISCWANVERNPTGEEYFSIITSRFIDKGRTQSPQQGGYMFYAAKTGNWEFWISKGLRVEEYWHEIKLGEIRAKSWTYLAASYSDSKLSLYLNGQLVSETEVNFLSNTDKPLRIGTGVTEEAPRYYFPGKIAHVRIYSKVLTPQEIKQDMVLGLIAGFDNSSLTAIVESLDNSTLATVLSTLDRSKFNDEALADALEKMREEILTTQKDRTWQSLQVLFDLKKR